MADTHAWRDLRMDGGAAAAVSAASAVSTMSALSGPVTIASQHHHHTSSLRCCCGRLDCLVLKHNCSVLEHVESDMRTAARLGKSLLERHEAYMADAERDRHQLKNRIGQLEMDKKELEAQNAKKIEENRALLDQLESLNSTMADSDTRVHMLEATLQSSQQIIRRLEGAAGRAEDMERHLAALEAEQALLQNSLVTTESEARSAIQRWKRAERGIADLQYQLEKMEKEAQEEHMRHAEIMGRMERQRAVERELSTAAGRLKGAAAAKSLHEGRSGSSGSDGSGSGNNGVVTHFVRDLLQDNAVLQLGMAELRELLVASNDEIQQLRDQLLFHQPLTDAEDSAISTLRAELGVDILAEEDEGEEARELMSTDAPAEEVAGVVVEEVAEEDGQVEDKAETAETSAMIVLDTAATPEISEAPDTLTVLETPATPATPVTPRTPRTGHASSLSQELHIHHHYHLINKKVEPKRPKKKRQSFSPSLYTPPPANSNNAWASPLSRSFGVYSPGPSSETAPSVISMASSGTDPRHTSRDSVSTALSGRSTRWSVLSDQPSEYTMSSVPSTPHTNPRNSYSFFSDRRGSCSGSVMYDFASPGSPVSPATSVDPLSPAWPMHRGSDGDGRESGPSMVACRLPAPALGGSERTDDVGDLSSARDLASMATSTTPTLSQGPFSSGGASTAAEVKGKGRAATEEKTDVVADVLAALERRPTLHRAVSHESIISLQGGLDIHTLKARPSQLLLRPLGSARATANTSISSVTARPVLSRASATASCQSHLALRDSLAQGLSRGRAVPTPTMVPGLPGLPTSRGRVVSTPTVSRVYASSISSNGSNGGFGGGGGGGGGYSFSSSPVRRSQSPRPSIRSNSSAGSRAATISGGRLGKLAAAWGLWASSDVASEDEEPARPASAASATVATVATVATAAVAVSTTAAAAVPTKRVAAASAADSAATSPPLAIPQASTPPMAILSSSVDTNMRSTRVAAQRAPISKSFMLEADLLRSPGINQPGAVPGFLEYWAAHQRRVLPSRVRPLGVDHEALREILEE